MTNRPATVCILGNSVSMLVQPFRSSAEDRTYGEHLRERGFTVVNRSKQAVVLTDVYRYFEDEVTREFPDYVILNFGIVDCTVRVRRRWLQNAFAMNAWNNSVINRVYNGPLHRGFLHFAKRFYAKTFEPALYALGLGRRWVSPGTFRFVLKDLVKRLFADTPAKRIILVGMLTPSHWLEREAPGTTASAAEYNTIMADLAAEYPALAYLDTEVAVAVPARSTVTWDGIHLTGLGHRMLADALEKLLTGERPDYTGWSRINQYGRWLTVARRLERRGDPASGPPDSTGPAA